MRNVKIFSFLLIAALILFVVVESRANAICNHPELGKCLTGIDDDPVTGSCSICCKAGGCKGAICKELKGMDPECHCLSLVFPK
ncbi:hypothetical protein ES332_D07G236200v1 [Gossypium tomentosum]|uniref:Uncharacterized protein n=1 Tax=Gossypium tomentosum TaxID=34277 RepID=A0A5D2KAS8_GOSTO|nr:hypothetical protein ES332_D07G236200v1 [Gossypium tomentosum]